MSNRPKRRKASPKLRRLHPTKGWRGSDFGGRVFLPMRHKAVLRASRKAVQKQGKLIVNKYL